jgi:hypothetical protein
MGAKPIIDTISRLVADNLRRPESVIKGYCLRWKLGFAGTKTGDVAKGDVEIFLESGNCMVDINN